MWALMSSKIVSFIFTRFGTIFVTVAFAVVLQFVNCFFHRNKKNVREVSKSFHFFCSRVTGTVSLQYILYSSVAW